MRCRNTSCFHEWLNHIVCIDRAHGNKTIDQRVSKTHSWFRSTMNFEILVRIVIVFSFFCGRLIGYIKKYTCVANKPWNIDIYISLPHSSTKVFLLQSWWNFLSDYTVCPVHVMTTATATTMMKITQRIIEFKLIYYVF